MIKVDILAKKVGASSSAAVTSSSATTSTWWLARSSQQMPSSQEQRDASEVPELAAVGTRVRWEGLTGAAKLNGCLGMGLHSFTFQLNLSCVWHTKTPYAP